jgi:two-component system chemotaxis response regulator CheB
MPVPLFLVQHMPPGFTATLARRLDDLAAVDVVEAADGMRAEPGRLHLAAGGRHLRLALKDRAVACLLDDAPPRLGCRPAFDNLLESMLEIYGGRILAVVMTGMGSDGTEGCRRLKEKGGIVIAQSADTCTVYGMPKAVVDRGLADAVVPLGSLADAVLACRAQPKTSERTSSAT